MGISLCKTSSIYCMYHFAANLPTHPFTPKTSTVTMASTMLSMYFRPRKILGVNTRDDHTHTDLYVKYVINCFISHLTINHFSNIYVCIYKISQILHHERQRNLTSHINQETVFIIVFTLCENGFNQSTMMSHNHRIFFFKMMTQAKTIHRS